MELVLKEIIIIIFKDSMTQSFSSLLLKIFKENEQNRDNKNVIQCRIWIMC